MPWAVLFNRFAVFAPYTSGTTHTIRAGRTSFLPQHQIHHPAATHMRAVAAAVGEDLGIGAAGFFEGIGEDGEAVEGAVGVDALGDLGDGGLVPVRQGR